MTESMIYWITRLDGIRGFCCGIQTIAVLFAVLGIIAAITTTCNAEDVASILRDFLV